ATRRRTCSSRWARPTTTWAASRRRGPGWRTPGRRTPRAVTAAAPASCSRTSPSSPRGAHLGRHQPMPYARILQDLLQSVPGARAALLLDSEGEVVVQVGARDERHRLIAAYQGITLGSVLRLA